MTAFVPQPLSCIGCELARQELDRMRVHRQYGTCGMIWYYMPPAAGLAKPKRPALGKEGGQ